MRYMMIIYIATKITGLGFPKIHENDLINECSRMVLDMIYKTWTAYLICKGRLVTRGRLVWRTEAMTKFPKCLWISSVHRQIGHGEQLWSPTYGVIWPMCLFISCTSSFHCRQHSSTRSMVSGDAELQTPRRSQRCMIVFGSSVTT